MIASLKYTMQGSFGSHICEIAEFHVYLEGLSKISIGASPAQREQPSQIRPLTRRRATAAATELYLSKSR
jgi:hypothetical protein